MKYRIMIKLKNATGYEAKKLVLLLWILKLLTIPFSHFMKYLHNRIEARERAQTTKNEEFCIYSGNKL